MSDITATSPPATLPKRINYYPHPTGMRDGTWKYYVFKRDGEGIKYYQKFSKMDGPFYVLRHLFALIFKVLIQHGLIKMLNFRKREIAELDDFSFADFSVVINVERKSEEKMIINFNYIHKTTILSIWIHIEFEGDNFIVSLITNKNINLWPLVQHISICEYRPEVIRSWAVHMFDLSNCLELDNVREVAEDDENRNMPEGGVKIVLNGSEYNARTDMAEIEAVFVGMCPPLPTD